MTLMTAEVESALPVLAFGRGAVVGWMAVVDCDGVTRMVAHHENCTSDNQRHILALVKGLRGPADGPSDEDERAGIEAAARDQLREWIETNEVDFLSGPRNRAVSVAQRAAISRITEVMSAANAPERAQLIVAATIAERMVRAVREVAAERGLETWLSFWKPGTDPREWLRAWRRVPSLSQVGLAMTRMTRIDRYSTFKVTALMVVEPLP